MKKERAKRFTALHRLTYISFCSASILCTSLSPYNLCNVFTNAFAAIKSSVASVMGREQGERMQIDTRLFSV